MKKGNNMGKGSTMKKGNRDGFTLVELLVVISIIALLLSILMPSLGKARDSAKAVVCMSNLRQLGVVSNLYTLDNSDEFMPFVWSSQVDYFWQEAFRAYYQNVDDIRFCPVATKLANPQFSSLQANQFGGHKKAWKFFQHAFYNGKLKIIEDTGSFGMNAWLYNAKSSYSELPPFGIYRNETYYFGKTTVKGASNIPLFFDSMWNLAWPDASDPWPTEPPQTGVQPTYPIHLVSLLRHGKKINSVFLDLSVRKTKLANLKKLKWNNRYDLTVASRNDPPDWMK